MYIFFHIFDYSKNFKTNEWHVIKTAVIFLKNATIYKSLVGALIEAIIDFSLKKNIF